jgi:hypothetical protein
MVRNVADRCSAAARVVSMTAWTPVPAALSLRVSRLAVGGSTERRVRSSAKPVGVGTFSLGSRAPWGAQGPAGALITASGPTCLGRVLPLIGQAERAPSGRLRDVAMSYGPIGPQRRPTGSG